MAKKETLLVTAALPYANGPIHLGHMVEYIQADLFVRAMRLFGKKVVFICADDTHGAPIEIKAASLGITPEQLIGRYDKEHRKDFADFGVEFDSYYTTNSPENKEYSDVIFAKLKKAGYIYQKKMEVIYCSHCNRFLPDRYVKGTCPKCKAQDQYGDVCENCGSTHKTTDLIDPKCSMCGKTPETRTSEHYFFQLSAFQKKLQQFFSTADLQPEIVHFVQNWLPELQDWCISRDGPYFGFLIPGETNKYYYVWLDAPVGYIASTAHYCDRIGGKVEDYWNNSQTKIIHFIGKDIVYFHLLFWPAMLMTAGFQLPSKIMVHGFLTVNKEKMSKSRGTFVTARQYLDCLPPEYLRFYYAAHLSSTLTDLDLDMQQFKEKINHELIASVANFCYRTLSFAQKNFKGPLGSFDKKDVAQELTTLEGLFTKTRMHYETLNFKEAVHSILEISALGNKYFQEHEPWKLILQDEKKTRNIVSFCIGIIKNISILLSPIMPLFSAALQQQLGFSDLTEKDIGFETRKYSLGTITPLALKIEKEHEQLLVVSSPVTKETAVPSPFPLLLKVGTILSVEDHPNADKLYVEKIDLGGEVRTIVSGIRQWYTKEDLVGKKVIIVANLKPAKLRGVMSEGMLLASHHGEQLRVLEAQKSKPGDIVFLGDEGKDTPRPKEIMYGEFEKFSIIVSKKRVICLGKKLHTEKEEIVVDMPDGSSVS